MPDTRVGTTFGHEFTGVVEEIGSSVQNLEVGDHVLVPFNIAFGSCLFCQKELYGNCYNTNPNATAIGAIYKGWGADLDPKNRQACGQSFVTTPRG